MRIEPVIGRLYCGGACRTTDALRHVVEQGITHVLNLDDFHESQIEGFDETSLQVFHYYLVDDGRARGSVFYEQTVKWAARALVEDTGNRVFVHCAAGRNRSTGVCYALLRTRYCLSPLDARDLIQGYSDRLAQRDPNWTTFDADAPLAYQADVEAWIAGEEGVNA